MTPWPTNKGGLWLSQTAFSQEGDEARVRGHISLGGNYCTPGILRFISHIKCSTTSVLTISFQSINKLAMVIRITDHKTSVKNNIFVLRPIETLIVYILYV